MTAPQDEQNFARRMAELRTNLDMSQSELARRMVEDGFESYSQMTVSRTEKGDRPIRLGEARALARILESSVEQMSRGEDLEENLYLAEQIKLGLVTAMLATAHGLGDYVEALEHASEVRSRLMSYDSDAAREAIDDLTVHVYPASAIAAWAAEAVTDPMRDIPEALVSTDFARLAELTDNAPERVPGDSTFGADNGEHQEAP